MLLSEIKFSKVPIADERNRIDCLNLSSIWSLLIKESAKCKCYASDVLHDIFTIVQGIQDKTLESQVLYFGFREMGVDHDTFIKYRLESGIEQYRALWVLTIDRDKDDYVTFKLYDTEV